MYKKMLFVFASVICVLALSSPGARALNLGGWGSTSCSKFFSPATCPYCLTVSSWGTGAGNTCVNPVMIEVTLRLKTAYGFCQNLGGNWRFKKPNLEPVSANFDAQPFNVVGDDSLGPDQLDFRGRFVSDVYFPETLLYDTYLANLSSILCPKTNWSLVPNAILPSYFYVHIDAYSCTSVTAQYKKWAGEKPLVTFQLKKVKPGEGDYSLYEDEDPMTDNYYYWDCGKGDYDIFYDPNGPLEQYGDVTCVGEALLDTAEGDCIWDQEGLPIKGEYNCVDRDIPDFP